jgi:hypothetical protein
MLKDVKSKSSNRFIVISDYVLQILQDKKAQQESMLEKLGHIYSNHDFVNCTDDGKPIDPRISCVNSTGSWKKLMFQK